MAGTGIGVRGHRRGLDRRGRRIRLRSRPQYWRYPNFAGMTGNGPSEAWRIFTATVRSRWCAWPGALRCGQRRPRRRFPVPPPRPRRSGTAARPPIEGDQLSGSLNVPHGLLRPTQVCRLVPASYSPRTPGGRTGHNTLFSRVAQAPAPPPLPRLCVGGRRLRRRRNNHGHQVDAKRGGPAAKVEPARNAEATLPTC